MFVGEWMCGGIVLRDAIADAMFGEKWCREASMEKTLEGRGGEGRGGKTAVDFAGWGGKRCIVMHRISTTLYGKDISIPSEKSKDSEKSLQNW